jgi:hypothetical protein
MDLNKIAYGNADRRELDLLQTENYLDVCFTDLTQYSFPPNDSETTRAELNELSEMCQALHQDEKSQKRFKAYDTSLHMVMIKYLMARGVEQKEAEPLVSSILRDIDPLIAKLKFYFQRPRPYQMSYYLRLKLFPFFSITSSNPSYPSGHAVQAKFFAEIIGNKYPKIYKDVHDFADDICLSRMYMGLHYQSDIDFATLVVDKVMKVQELKLKYQI